MQADESRGHTEANSLGVVERLHFSPDELARIDRHATESDVKLRVASSDA